MQDATLFWDRIAPKYAKSPVRDQQAYEATLARTRSYLGAEDKVLELGGTSEGEVMQRGPYYSAYVRDLDGNKLCFGHMATVAA